MRLATWCSGIGAPEMAAAGFGFTSHSVAEIDPFPCAVLAARWPGVPNLGDLTAEDFLPRFLAHGIPDAIMAGTPCQAFSVAGLRKGLQDARGNLTLVALEHLNGIADAARLLGRPRPVFIWENVPGAMSDKTNAFGCLLAGLVGHDSPIEAPGGAGWADAGMVAGPARRAAWRVLDAQYFGVAQRRARVFLVASPPERPDPAEILFERAGVRRHPPSRRSAREDAARDAAAGAGAGGGGGALSHWDGDYPHPTLNQSASGSGGVGASNQEIFSQRGAYLVPAVARCLTSHPSRSDAETETWIIQCVTGERTHALTAEGMDASEDGTGRGTPIIAEPMIFQDSEFGVAAYPTADALRAGRIPEHQMLVEPVAFHPTQDPISSEGFSHAIGTGSSAGAASAAVVYAIQENAEAESVTRGPSGMGVKEDQAFTLLARNKVQAAAFSAKDHGQDASVDLAPTLRAMSNEHGNPNGGGQIAVALPGQAPIAFQDRFRGDDGRGYSRPPPTSDDLCGTLETVKPWHVAVRAHAEGAAYIPPVATALRARDGAKGVDSDATDTRIAFDATQVTSPANRSNPKPGDPCHPLAASAHPPAIAGTLQANGKAAGSATQQDAEQGMLVPVAGTGAWHVRRLTPMECERLQGFPDEFTHIAYRGKPAEACPDGPRYKALGNSMAVPVVRWILARLAATLSARRDASMGP